LPSDHTLPHNFRSLCNHLVGLQPGRRHFFPPLIKLAAGNRRCARGRCRRSSVFQFRDAHRREKVIDYSRIDSFLKQSPSVVLAQSIDPSSPAQVAHDFIRRHPPPGKLHNLVATQRPPEIEFLLQPFRKSITPHRLPVRKVRGDATGAKESEANNGTWKSHIAATPPGHK